MVVVISKCRFSFQAFKLLSIAISSLVFDLLQNSYHAMLSLAGQAFIHFKLFTTSIVNLFTKLSTKLFTKFFTKYVKIYKIFFRVSLGYLGNVALTCKENITFLSDLFCYTTMFSSRRDL